MKSQPRTYAVGETEVTFKSGFKNCSECWLSVYLICAFQKDKAFKDLAHQLNKCPLRQVKEKEE